MRHSTHAISPLSDIAVGPERWRLFRHLRGDVVHIQMASTPNTRARMGAAACVKATEEFQDRRFVTITLVMYEATLVPRRGSRRR